MAPEAPDLAALVAVELRRPAPPGAARLAERIRARLGPATRAVLFYGSCLRRDTSEGVLDFYAVVDSYRAAYPSRTLALANAVLPPNVFYVEAPSGAETLRAKYAVLSQHDFARGAAGEWVRTGIWARFCQPALAVWVRDEAAADEVIAAVVEAHLTAVRRSLPLLPVAEPVSYEALWRRIFRETYAGEMRPEADRSIAGLYAADPVRYDRVAVAALRELAARGESAVAEVGALGLRLDASVARPGRARRVLGRALAKGAYVAQLVKTAFTFGDWLPYALWKLERHTGAHIEASERQRRHPFLFGWPILWRVLARRELR